VLFARIVGRGYAAPQGFEGAIHLEHIKEMVKEWVVLKVGFAREISHGGEVEILGHVWFLAIICQAKVW
jgi:hypothetical protein